MKRQIKFRVWKDKMYYPHEKGSDCYLSFFAKGLIPWGLYELGTDARLVTGDPDAILNTPGILMQFTGLLDKNGKEIYESDVVYLAGYGNYTVVWPFTELFDAGNENGIGEIIGNVHANPDLL